MDLTHLTNEQLNNAWLEAQKIHSATDIYRGDCLRIALQKLPDASPIMNTTNYENELKLPEPAKDAPTPPPGFHLATKAELDHAPEGMMLMDKDQEAVGHEGWVKSILSVGASINHANRKFAHWCCPDAPTEELVTATGTQALVCRDIAKRQAFGMSKYGVSVAENPLNTEQWLTHLYEELLDGAVYAKRAIGMVTPLREERDAALARAEQAESRADRLAEQVKNQAQGFKDIGAGALSAAWMMKAALASAPEASGEGWMPIESAPRDTMAIHDLDHYGPRLMMWEGGHQFIARWWERNGRSNWIDDGGNARRPTHWQPLPPPPSNSTSTAKE